MNISLDENLETNKQTNKNHKSKKIYKKNTIKKVIKTRKQKYNGNRHTLWEWIGGRRSQGTCKDPSRDVNITTVRFLQLNPIITLDKQKKFFKKSQKKKKNNTQKKINANLVFETKETELEFNDLVCGDRVIGPW
jgi:hypothetical protein